MAADLSLVSLRAFTALACTSSLVQVWDETDKRSVPYPGHQPSQLLCPAEEAFNVIQAIEVKEVRSSPAGFSHEPGWPRGSFLDRNLSSSGWPSCREAYRCGTDASGTCQVWAGIAGSWGSSSLLSARRSHLLPHSLAVITHHTHRADDALHTIRHPARTI